jgi:hypothetical protein
VIFKLREQPVAPVLKLVAGADFELRLGFPKSERFPLCFARPVKRLDRSARDSRDLNLRTIVQSLR